MITIPSKSETLWRKFIKEHELVVNKYIARELSSGIESNEKKVELWKFDDKEKIYSITENHYLTVLNILLKKFISTEEYEYADLVKKSIISFNVNKVIEDSIDLIWENDSEE